MKPIKIRAGKYRYRQYVITKYRNEDGLFLSTHKHKYIWESVDPITNEAVSHDGTLRNAIYSLDRLDGLHRDQK